MEDELSYFTRRLEITCLDVRLHCIETNIAGPTRSRLSNGRKLSQIATAGDEVMLHPRAVATRVPGGNGEKPAWGQPAYQLPNRLLPFRPRDVVEDVRAEDEVGDDLWFGSEDRLGDEDRHRAGGAELVGQRGVRLNPDNPREPVSKPPRQLSRPRPGVNGDSPLRESLDFPAQPLHRLLLLVGVR